MTRLPGFRSVFSACTLMMAAPVLAQSDSTATTPPPAAAEQSRPRINLLVTVPRAEVNQAQQQECANQADAGTISGEIVVCGTAGTDGKPPLTGDRAASQRRYAEETALKGAPRAPLFNPGCKDQGNPVGCSTFGSAPPPALFIDVEALPTAPSGSDADRIARGLPPLGKDGELSEEEERARREAAGIKTTVPPRSKK